MWAAILHFSPSTLQTESKLTGANFSYELDPFFGVQSVRCSADGRAGILPQARQVLLYHSRLRCKYRFRLFPLLLERKKLSSFRYKEMMQNVTCICDWFMAISMETIKALNNSVSNGIPLKTICSLCSEITGSTIGDRTETKNSRITFPLCLLLSS